MEMRVSDWFRRWLGLEAAEGAVAALANSQAAITGRLDEIEAALSRLTLRVDGLTEAHADLVRQVGLQQGDTIRQLSDLRNIVAQLGEKAKEKPAAARSMADVRRFVGENDAD